MIHDIFSNFDAGDAASVYRYRDFIVRLSLLTQVN